VIPIGIGLGLTGFPYFGHDIGGYMSQLTQPTTKELFFRWTSLGALSPVMRTHHGKSAAENWSWERDAETIAHFRRWAELHQRLFPYLYGLARQASDTGLPMMRPLALGWPGWDPGWTLTDTYLLGDRIVVAPVVEEGATEREVALPAGTFHPLLGGDPVTLGPGGGTVTVTAPVTECPAFVPAGTLLVLLPEGVDTVVTADASPDVVTLDDVGDDRELWLWPGGGSTWTEVAGRTYVWDATLLDGPVTAATWNDVDVPVEAEGIVVTGNGRLVLNGGDAELVAAGAAESRTLVVRCLGLE
jgi:sulfoquinovosidase